LTKKRLLNALNYLADKIDELERALAKAQEELAIEKEREQAKVEIIP
jgi:hypothetical protein